MRAPVVRAPVGRSIRQSLRRVSLILLLAVAMSAPVVRQAVTQTIPPGGELPHTPANDSTFVLEGNATLSSPLTVPSLLTITGAAGGSTITLSGGSGGYFNLSSPPATTLTLSNVTIAGRNNTAGGNSLGGAINGPLTPELTIPVTGSVTFSNNTVTGTGSGGGAIYMGRTGGNFPGSVSIVNGGQATSNSVTFSNNTVTGTGSGGGAIIARGSVSIGTSASPVTSVTFTGNTATNYFGGGIYSAPAVTGGGTGKVTIYGDEVTLSNNTSGAGGGAIYAQDGITIIGNTITASGNVSGAFGGALQANNNITISGNSIMFSDNEAAGAVGNGGGGAIQVGGDLPNSNVSIAGGNVVLSGNRADFGGAIQVSGATTIIGNEIVLSGNTATGASEFGGYGGAVAGLGLSSDVLIDGNEITLSDNTASTSAGGAIYATGNVSIGNSGSTVDVIGNMGAFGGAVAGLGLTSDVLIDGNEITLSDNTATTSTGGAIYATGNVSIGNSGSTVDVIGNMGAFGGAINGSNVSVDGQEITLSGNTATSSQGGAIYTPGNVSIGNSESTIDIIGNRAPTLGGAIRSVGATMINGNAMLSDNIAGTNGGAVYAGNGFTLTPGSPTGAMVTGNTAGGQGGAIFLNGGNLVLNALGGNITFSDNTKTGGAPNAIYFNNAGVAPSQVEFNTAAGQKISFFDPIESNGARGIVSVTKTGPGTVSFDVSRTENVSNIYAQTTVQGGTFEVAHGAVYGVNAESTSFTVNSGATLQGGVEGTVAANQFILQPDATLNIAGSTPAGSPFSVFTLATSSDSAIFEQGSLVKFNTFLGDDGSPSDLLVINGGSATGNSSVLVTNTNGPGALTTGNGIRLVEAINGATTALGTFTLAAPAVAGPYEYTLLRGGVTTAVENDWFLRSELCGPGGNCGGDNGGGDNGGGGFDPSIPDYRQEVSLDTAILPVAAIYGRHIIGTLHERIGEQEQLKGHADLREDQNFNGAWGRLIGRWGHKDGGALGIYGAGGPEFDYGFGAMQMGVDIYGREYENGMRDHAGLYFGFGHGEIDVTHNRAGRSSFDAGSDSFDAATVGGYWTRYGENNWYLDGVVQGTWYNVTTKSQRDTLIGFPDQDVNGFGFAASLEGGYPFYFGNGWQIEPQAQLVYQNINMDSFNDGAAEVRFDDLDSLAGRIGARLARSWAVEEVAGGEPARLATAWGRVNVWHEFLDGSATTEFSSANGFIPFSADLQQDWIEAGIGGSLQVTRSITVYGNVNYETTFDGDDWGAGGKIGMRIIW